jgi:hypothetical protein
MTQKKELTAEEKIFELRVCAEAELMHEVWVKGFTLALEMHKKGLLVDVPQGDDSKGTK